MNEEIKIDDEIFDSPKDKRKKIFVAILSVVLVVAIACVTAVLLKTYVITSIPVSGSSMEPTLEGGVYNLENGKVVETVSKGDTLLLDRVAKIKQGDIIVFSVDDTKELVKRVIGVAGDHIVIKDGHVYRNDTLLDEDYIKGSTYASGGSADNGEIIDIVVPENHVYCLGDNRENSRDSRSFGAISLDCVVGKCFLIVDKDGGLRLPK